MKSSEITYHKPKIFNSSVISSIFTLANRHKYNVDNKIQGLNLGLNTPEKAEVINSNRRVLAGLINSSADDLCFIKQVHGTDVGYVTQGGLHGSMDGFFTDVPGLALCIQVADCAAVLFADEDNQVIGAAHAGWRGAINGILPNIIRRMSELGADPKQIKAYMSPCISLESFEVGPEVAVQFPERYVESHRFEKPHIDLKAFIGDQLLESGLMPGSIESDSSCTMADPKYYSYRREGQKSGRMMGVIKLNTRES